MGGSTRRYFKKDSSISNGDDTKGDLSTTDATSSKSGTFTESELDAVGTYLEAYQRGAQRICFPSKEDLNRESDDEKSTTLIIGNVEFPALTENVLAQPYLALPSSLTTKQRRLMHELCEDVDLFHSSAGTRGSDRHLVLSIHSNGFQFVDDLSVPEKPVPVRQCRPWLLRNENSAEETKQGKDLIHQLFDQPGTCLRDNMDILDFETVLEKNLADIPQPHEDSNWMLVDSQEKMRQCAQELMDGKPTEIGFDLEMYNPSKYVQVTCLFQIVSNANAGKEYIIDTLAPGVWETVPLLAPLFADKNIVKIGHCIGGMDIKSLHLDFGIFVVNAFDTYQAARALRLESKGLASICSHYGLQDSEAYSELKETHQRLDWRKRPLSQSMVRYGRYDVHYLIPLRILMMRDLTRSQLWDLDREAHELESRQVASVLASMLRTMEEEEGDVDLEDEEMQDALSSNPSFDGDGYYTPAEDGMLEGSRSSLTKQTRFGAKELRMQADLMRVISESQQQCLALWSFTVESHYKNSALLNLVKQGQVEWTASHMELYEELVQWRTRIATQMGALPGLVCSLDLLVKIAAKRPACEASLRRIQYHLPDFLEEDQYCSQLLLLVRTSLERDGLDPNKRTVPRYSLRNTEDNETNKSRSPPASETNTSGGRTLLALKLTTAVAVVAIAVVAVARHRRK